MISAGDRGGVLRERGRCGRREKKLAGGPGLQREERGDARAVSEGWLTCGPRWQAVRD